MEGRRVYSKDFHSLLKNIKSLSDSQAEVIEWDDADLSTFIVEICPNDGLYKGGKFKFNFNVYEDWPDTSPIITCLTKIYHPNIDKQTDCEPDCDCTNVCANGLEDDWDPIQSLDDCIQILLFLFYEPNIGDPLSSGFPSTLTSDMFAENVKISLKGGVVNILNTDSTIEFEPNYGWLQNNKKESTEEKEASDGKLNSDVISDTINESEDVNMHSPSENSSDKVEVSHEPGVSGQQSRMNCTTDYIPAVQNEEADEISDEKGKIQDIEMSMPPFQRQTSKKDAFVDKLVSENIFAVCQNEDIQCQTEPSSVNLLESRQVPRILTERYVNMCNTLRQCADIVKLVVSERDFPLVYF